MGGWGRIERKQARLETGIAAVKNTVRDVEMQPDAAQRMPRLTGGDRNAFDVKTAPIGQRLPRPLRGQRLGD